MQVAGVLKFAKKIIKKEEEVKILDTEIPQEEKKIEEQEVEEDDYED